MKRYLSRGVFLLGLCLLLLGFFGTAFAGNGPFFETPFGHHHHHLWHHHHHHHWRHHDRAPELDPNLILGGLAFVSGAALLLSERYRRR